MIIRTVVITTLLLIAATLTGCATNRSEPLVDTSACPSASTRVGGRNDLERLEELQRRADAFADCMTAHGFAPDQDALDRDVLRYEQTRNADPYGVDPQLSVRMREQQLRLSPKYWRKATAG